MKNQPLQIVLTDPAAQPYDFTSGTKPNTSATPCDDTTFFINVDDPDVGDTIRSLWFIDKTDVSLPFRPNPVTPGATVTRKVTQPNSTAFKTAMSSLTTGTHLLTVFVVDTDFDESDTGTIAAASKTVNMPDGSQVQDPGSIDQYTWVLRAGPACQ